MIDIDLVTVLYSILAIAILIVCRGIARWYFRLDDICEVLGEIRDELRHLNNRVNDQE